LFPDNQHSASLAKRNLCWKQEQFLTVHFCQLQIATKWRCRFIGTEQIISLPAAGRSKSPLR